MTVARFDSARVVDTSRLLWMHVPILCAKTQAHGLARSQKSTTTYTRSRPKESPAFFWGHSERRRRAVPTKCECFGGCGARRNW